MPKDQVLDWGELEDYLQEQRIELAAYIAAGKPVYKLQYRIQEPHYVVVQKYPTTERDKPMEVFEEEFLTLNEAVKYYNELP